MGKKQIARISLITLVVFGLLISGNALYKKYWVDKNLSVEVSNIPGIVSAQVVEKNGGKELEVYTSDQVADLKLICEELEGLSMDLPIRFMDHRSDELTEFYRTIQFALQEGIARGNFTNMADFVAEKALQEGVAAKLDMDGKNIYLILNKGEGQLLSVLDRQEKVRYLPSQKQGS